MPRVARDFDERKITSYLVSKLMSGEEVCIICKRKIPRGAKHGFHYSLQEKQQEKEVPENREGPEEEPDSTAGLQLQAAAIELPDQNSLNDVGSEDQQQSRQVKVEAPPGSSRVKKKKFSSLPAPSKESLRRRRLLKEINATEEHMDVVLPPPPPAPAPATPVPQATFSLTLMKKKMKHCAQSEDPSESKHYQIVYQIPHCRSL
ncbi:hypothetical protein DMENIID0001_138090 [Sergentomyia squamirostris]